MFGYERAMLIWAIFAAMTGAAVFALLRPLGRRAGASFAGIADARSLYESQLTEIERDQARGLIRPADAEAARTEAARRLLRASRDETPDAGETEGSLRRRRASSALALSAVPLLALLIYGAQGSPEEPDRPLAARIQAGPAADFEVALARIEGHLAANPTDGRGWAVLAPVYLRQRRFDDAARAFSQAIANGGEKSADLQVSRGEALALAAGGVVTAGAREAFAAALALDASNARARYFLALALEQDGDRAGAEKAMRELLASAPADAPWAGAVREHMMRLAAESGRDAIAALPEDQRAAAIRGMVDGLEQRLRENGGSVPEWARLIRSQVMLGETDAARRSLAIAREKMAAGSAERAQIDEVAGGLGLTETPK